MVIAAPILIAAASLIAHKPINVACDADTNFGSTGPPPPGYAVEAWTSYGGDTVHMLPQLCEFAVSRPGTPEFAAGIRVLIHESAHARGIRREACAEMTADIGVYDVVRQLWNIQFFTLLSAQIGSQVLQLTRLRPPNYQPEGCWQGSPT